MLAMLRRRWPLALMVLLGSSAAAFAGITAYPGWSVQGEEDHTAYGRAIAGAGDVNGDGYEDLIVGERYYDDTSQFGQRNGRAYLFLGTTDGLSLTPAWVSSGDGTAYQEFGAAVAGAGDVNGDGFGDVLIGAPVWGDFLGEQVEGKVYLYLGSPSGLSQAPVWTARSDQPRHGYDSARFGETVAGAGDVNGDGFGDVLIGASGYTDAEYRQGLALLFHGSASWDRPEGTPANADWSARVEVEAATLGSAVAGAGDVNGDGFADVLLGARSYTGELGDENEGLALLFHGGASGLGADGTPDNADWTAESNRRRARLGETLAFVGDLNGDGYDDVLIAAPSWEGSTGFAEGRLFVWVGSKRGLGADGTPTNADWVTAGLGGLVFGETIAALGDVNGDGYADLAGAHSQIDNEANADLDGRLLAWFGGPPEPFNPTGLGPIGTLDSVDWLITGDGLDRFVGLGLAAGDFDGDGFRDVAAWTREKGSDLEGAISFFGACGSIDADGDGLADPGDPGCVGQTRVDCDETNGLIWGAPSAVRGLTFDADAATLRWIAPARTGAAPGSVVYDLLRSEDAADFLGAACIESDDVDLTAEDLSTPPPAIVFHYLARAENGCPAGIGSLGTDSDGVEREGAGCP